MHWIVLIAVAAVAGLQYMWLANSYRLAEESLRMKANEVFRDASIEEMFHRMSVYNLQGAKVRKERLFFGAKVRGRYSEFCISEYAEQLADVEHPYRDAGLYLF